MCFEEAMNHGYSREEFASEMEEYAEEYERDIRRCAQLGCENCITCRHFCRPKECEEIFENEAKYSTCPYRETEEEAYANC